MKLHFWVLVFSFISPYQAFGGFKKLREEFNQINSTILKSNLNLSLGQLSKELVFNNKPWLLEASTTKNDYNLDASSKFSNITSETTIHSLAIKRNFNWGGGLGFENNLIKGNRDGSNAEIVFGDTGTPRTIYEFNQAIAYTQQLGGNFFGRDDRRERDQAVVNYDLQRGLTEQELDQANINFYVAYLDTKMAQELLELQNQALIRMTKSKNAIDKFVKDGLKEKVDLMKAQAAVFLQEENINAAEVSFNHRLDQLSSMLHRQVLADEIEKITESNPILDFLPTSFNGENQDIIALKKRVQLTDFTLDRIDYSIFPNIDLKLKYKNNDYDAQINEVMNKGKFGGSKDEFSIGLNVAMPIGFEMQKIEKSKKRIEANMLKLEIDKLSLSLMENEKNLRRSIDKINQNISSSKNRITLSKNVLDEYNKLYKLGKATLDQVIRAEEDLIQTESSHVRYVDARDNSIISLAHIHGKVRNFLNQIGD